MDQSVLNATSLKAVKRNGNDHCFSAGIICIHKTLDDGTKLKDMKDGSECIYSKIYIDCGNLVLLTDWIANDRPHTENEYYIVAQFASAEWKGKVLALDLLHYRMLCVEEGIQCFSSSECINENPPPSNRPRRNAANQNKQNKSESSSNNAAAQSKEETALNVPITSNNKRSYNELLHEADADGFTTSIANNSDKQPPIKKQRMTHPEVKAGDNESLFSLSPDDFIYTEDHYDEQTALESYNEIASLFLQKT